MDASILIAAIVAIWGAWMRERAQLKSEILLEKRQSAESKAALVKTIGPRAMGENEIAVLAAFYESLAQNFKKYDQEEFKEIRKTETEKIQLSQVKKGEQPSEPKTP